MTKVQELKQLADLLTEEEAGIVIQLILKMEKDYAIPDEREKKAINRWKSMTDDERQAELIPAEEVYKELGLAE